MFAKAYLLDSMNLLNSLQLRGSWENFHHAYRRTLFLRPIEKGSFPE